MWFKHTTCHSPRWMFSLRGKLNRRQETPCCFFCFGRIAPYLPSQSAACCETGWVTCPHTGLAGQSEKEKQKRMNKQRNKISWTTCLWQNVAPRATTTPQCCHMLRWWLLAWQAGTLEQLLEGVVNQLCTFLFSIFKLICSTKWLRLREWVGVGGGGGGQAPSTIINIMPPTS